MNLLSIVCTVNKMLHVCGWSDLNYVITKGQLYIGHYLNCFKKVLFLMKYINILWRLQ